MLKERQESILTGVIREYIRTARPVASGELAERYKPSLSPATIRNEMLELDELGFLEQPHTSAGRVPTDKGYRFYVDALLEQVDISKCRNIEISSLRALEELLESPFDDFGYLSARVLARVSRSFVLCGSLADNVFYKAGFAEVLTEPEFEDSDATRGFMELADFIDEKIPEFFGTLNLDFPRVFIGEENPIREARDYGMIISSVELPAGEEIMALLGPRRMNYAKNISLVNYLKKNARRKRTKK